MDIKLCRICGKQDDNYIHIFKTEGLKNKIETCLPIVITRECPLPDTICNSCLESVDNFYCFIKNCLQNIIVLEAQYEIIESCLKTKRKVDKSVLVDDSDFHSEIKTETLTSSDYVKSFTNFNFTSSVNENLLSSTKDNSTIPNFTCSLVDYDSSDDNSEEEPSSKNEDLLKQNKRKTDENKCNLVSSSEVKQEKNEEQDSNTENTQVESEQVNIINEIVQRKYLKRKNDDVVSNISKIARIENESSSRRKNKQPKKVEYHLGAKIETAVAPIIHSYSTPEDSLISEKLLNLPAEISVTREEVPTLPIQEPVQTCLLCEQQFLGPLQLTTHMYETHGIDLAQVFAASQPIPLEKPSPKKKIPNLVKISDVLNVRKQLPQENYDEPPVLEPQEKISIPSLPPALHRGIYTCQDCDESLIYHNFKDYSNHRRSKHQIFHCDLCTKSYGRNSHLWKHVNRVHKGHPSITCQQCYKTSASKYHLAQHFNKMHSVKSQKPKVSTVNKSNSGYGTPEENDEEFMNQKFQGFDFKSVRQSFLRQDMLDKQKYVSVLKKQEDDTSSVKSNTKEDSNKKDIHSDSENCKDEVPKAVKKNETIAEPKEIDSSSNLYTNIITNYTPPVNEGAFKCPKCFKGFHKKHLLKKHKKNCRPRLQKDLLTRCKTCSRIFKDRQSLAKHLINYHSEYTCEICNLAVQSKCEIVSHIRFSHPNSELTCHCGQILRSKSDLQKHKMDHRDSHVCQFCGDTLPTKIKLKMHILSLHRKILSLSCGICLKLFETQHILRDHVRLVHGDQLSPLTSCTVCGKNYGSKWKTYDHLNKSHGRIFKACKACLEVFETEQDLQKHFEMDHLNSKNNTADKKTPSGEKKGRYSPDTNENQDFNQAEENSTSESEEEETSGESSSVQNTKTLQDDMEYRNYVIREFQSNLEKKSGQNGLGAKTESKKTENLKAQENKLSLLEKRLLGKKITEDDVKVSQKNENKHKNKSSDSVVENGNKEKEKEKSDKKKSSSKSEKYDEDPMQNSSKRTVYVNSNDPSLCEICLKVWPAKKHLWQHYIRCHKQVAATVCGICLKTNPSYSSLQTHLRETHPNLLYGCGFGSNFICKICGRYHNASSKLKLHMAIHVGFNESMLENFNDMKEISPLEQEKTQTDEDSSESDVETNENDNDTDNIKVEVKEELMEDNDDDMNYESLIEEVEVDSESETELNNDDHVYSVTSKQSEEPEMSSSDEDEGEGEEDVSENEMEVDDSENEVTENELEQEMLKNMIGENVTIVNNVSVNSDDNGKDLSSNDDSQSSDYDSHLKDEQNESGYDLESCKVKMEVCSSDEWMASPHFIKSIKHLKTSDYGEDKLVFYQRKELELDNAIRSISYDEDVAENVEFPDVSSSLNENELETAVGSIL